MAPSLLIYFSKSNIASKSIVGAIIRGHNMERGPSEIGLVDASLLKVPTVRRVIQRPLTNRIAIRIALTH